MREKNYAYKKEIQERLQRPGKNGLVVKESKGLGKKGSNFGSKSQERRSASGLRRSETTPENFNKKKEGQKYAIKTEMIEENYD